MSGFSPCSLAVSRSELEEPEDAERPTGEDLNRSTCHTSQTHLSISASQHLRHSDTLHLQELPEARRLRESARQILGYDPLEGPGVLGFYELLRGPEGWSWVWTVPPDFHLFHFDCLKNIFQIFQHLSTFEFHSKCAFGFSPKKNWLSFGKLALNPVGGLRRNRMTRSECQKCTEHQQLDGYFEFCPRFMEAGWSIPSSVSSSDVKLLFSWGKV